MIWVFINKNNLEYDIYTLFKAFFPEEEINIVCNTPHKESGRIPSFYDILCSEERIYCGFYQEDKPVNEKTAIILKDDISNTKNSIKRCLYDLLKEQSLKELPWGILTGIRPVKLPMMMLKEGKSQAGIEKFLQDNYYVSPEKSALSYEIAVREKNILDKINVKTGYSLYIGIPFCPTTCLYCSFTSYPLSKWKERIPLYLEHLKKEIKEVKELYAGTDPDTVYIGGGTPTTLSAEQLEELISYLNSVFDLSKVLEFTVEAGRPDSITREKLKVMKKCGVNRISINPQTMNDETLKIIGRHHTTEDIKQAFFLAREYGFDNINMDIILGLPGEKSEHVLHTMSEINKLKPDSLTVHSMAIKRAAKMSEYLKLHPELKSINTYEMMSAVDENARALNLKPYYLYRQKNMSGNFENIGYAKEEKYGIYNILIMEEVQSIVACGAGTVSKRVYENGKIERCDNVKDIDLYMNRFEEMLERKRKLFASSQ
ncbi:MAG: coproporphyrinogen dehydrogenase HemZ [Lachnospiraceae bacterium]|nr:coproporphyrinogen dehydrogenase HemZ [Lachnospiraceae bacterium]